MNCNCKIYILSGKRAKKEKRKLVKVKNNFYQIKNIESALKVRVEFRDRRSAVLVGRCKKSNKWCILDLKISKI